MVVGPCAASTEIVASIKVLMQQEIRSVELWVCPMQLFHFWSRDVHPVHQFKVYCCVQNFMKIGLFFAEIWRYIDFQNGGCPPSWNCFTTIRDHPRRLYCWPQLPVKFHVNLVHRSEDIAIWIFRIDYLAWNAYSGPQNGGLGDFGPLNVIIHHRDPPPKKKRKSASFKLSTVNKNPLSGLTCRRVDRKCTHTHTHR